MTDAAPVLAKLSTLREHAERMDRRRPATVEAFGADVDRQDALALSLVVAVQEATDIALHIASDEGWGIPSSYADSFELLARHGVIPPELAARMVGMTALRNRVATDTGAWISSGCGARRRREWRRCVSSRERWPGTSALCPAPCGADRSPWRPGKKACNSGCEHPHMRQPTRFEIPLSISAEYPRRTAVLALIVAR